MLIWSFSKHTFIQLEKIEYVCRKGKNYIYRLKDAEGNKFKEERPENWAQVLYELNQLDTLAEYLEQMLLYGDDEL